MEAWWPKLKPLTRDWLIANNGEALPSPVLEDIAGAGGSIASNAWWVGENGPSGSFLSDAAIDWIEAVANGEQPEAP